LIRSRFSKGLSVGSVLHQKSLAEFISLKVIPLIGANPSFSMAAYLGSYLVAPLVKEVLSSTGLTSTTGQQIEGTLANAKRTLRTAEETASQIRSLLDNPGAGLSGQPTIPRARYTQELAGFYSKIFPCHHVLVLYDRLPRLLYIHGVIASDGGIVDGPTSGDVVTGHKKIQRGYLQCGLWGFHMYIFREGRLKNLGDGGYDNWAWESPKFKRDGKEVVFELVELPEKEE